MSGRTFRLNARLVSPAAVLSILLVLVPGADIATVAQECRRCSVTLEKLVELGSEDDPVGRSTAVVLVKRTSGDFVFSPLFQAPQLAIYTVDGQFMQLYDRTGAGPGELLRSPWPTPGRGDTLFTVDGNRLSTFDHDLVPISTQQLPFRPKNGAIVLSNGTLVVNHPLVRNGGTTFAVQVLSRKGEVVASVDTMEATERVQWEDWRVFAPSIRGGFWVAPVNQSRVTEYTLSGDVLRTVVVNRPWFTRWGGYVDGEGTRVRPRPRVHGISQLGEARLLLATLVADERWSPIANLGADISRLDTAALYDTVLEVIDVSTGIVVGETRVDVPLQMVRGGNDLVSAVRETGSGDHRVVVWRVRVEAKK